ncbi:hypothetical protein [Roseovarius sp.]|uniref:hypothetical protein n=1 Tax=Roseovarius sp. TaxID=1486281 RepID=UPI003A973343
MFVFAARPKFETHLLTNINNIRPSEEDALVVKFEFGFRLDMHTQANGKDINQGQKPKYGNPLVLLLSMPPVEEAAPIACEPGKIDFITFFLNRARVPVGWRCAPS